MKIIEFTYTVLQILKFKLHIDRKSQILRHLRNYQPINLLEIGVHKGEFAKRMLSQIDNERHHEISYTGIDLFASLHTKAINIKEGSLWPDSKKDVYKKLSETYPRVKVNLMEGFSEKCLKKIRNKKFDFIFIDGGHSYKTVYSDWMRCKELIAPNGFIFFDDFINESAIKHTRFGINKVINGIDSKFWNIETLPRKDCFKKKWGILKIQIIKVSKK